MYAAYPPRARCVPDRRRRNDERVKGRRFSRGRTRGRGRERKGDGYVRRERNPEKKVPECVRASDDESGSEARTMKGERAERL